MIWYPRFEGDAVHQRSPVQNLRYKILSLAETLCYANRAMRKTYFVLILFVLLALLHGTVSAGTYSLTDGQQISGDPISFDQNGLILKSDGVIQPRMPWKRFTQDSLKQLLAEAKTPKDKAFVEPLIEEEPQAKAKAKEIVIKPVEHPERPTNTGFFKLFSSPLGIFLFLVIYAATIYAAYEVALFRGHAVGLTCGLAAIPFLGILSPIIFLFVHSHHHAAVAVPTVAAEDAHQHEAPHYEPAAPVYEQPAEQPHVENVPPAQRYTPPPQAPAPGSYQAAAQQKPAAPTVVTFRRGEFTFNRRFFETKFAGFARAVPGDAEKDSVLYVKSLRGEYVGRKITSMTQTDLVLQIFKGDATADETIPYSEISEVQIRPKDVA